MKNVSHPQGQIIDVNKSAINRNFDFFQPLSNLSENWSFATCITNLGGMYENLFKISCPQVNVNADNDADTDDAEP